MAENTIPRIGYHDKGGALDAQVLGTASSASLEVDFTYSFENFFHPYVGELIAKLNKGSLSEMLSGQLDNDLFDYFFEDAYQLFDDFDETGVNDLSLVKDFPKRLDFTQDRPYAGYNWELFFHVPLTVAVHLSKNQRFAEAQRWFHYIFDPTSNEPGSVFPQQQFRRFWKFRVFRSAVEGKQIEDIVRILSTPRFELDPDEQSLQDEILNGYDAIRDRPFQPHRVARTRPLAYQYQVVMKYLDNLISWGDHLFQQDTVESIGEATQLYVLAANILGERPQRIPPRGTVRPKTFAQLKAEGLGPIGNALVELEGQFPFNLATPDSGAGNNGDTSALFGIGRTLYFCIPRNDKLLGYWDVVADRLFKVRNCMNIQGVVRPLALFDPPIDPGMLVKAAASGIDVGSIVGGLNQPVGPVRCLLLIQKSLELCGEVRGLGNALLSALEKGDAERLGLIRQGHEIKVQQLAQDVRFLQWKSAQEATTSLLTSRRSSLERLRYYQRLLGLPADQNAPETIAIDRRELTEENFDEAYGSLVGQYDRPLGVRVLPALKIAGETSPEQQSGASGQGNLYLNTNEDVELTSHSPRAQESRDWAARMDMTASTLSSIPGFSIKMHFWGLGAAADIPVGTMLSNAARAVGSHFSNEAQREDRAGQNASKTGSFERRADEWLLQYNLAAHELMQNGRQILTALIAEQIAHHEYKTIEQQIEDSQEVYGFLQDKFTNEDLYLWMQGEISRLYYEYYRFAVETARKAERTMKQELMRPEVEAQEFIKFNYWDGGRKGLLSGEALYLDVKRMEMAYHENNKRELELTKHVSLRQLDPIALLALKATGSCQLTIPEWLYDLDGPGHYMRRIKSVALSVPAVVGPYTGVNCTLSLLKSSLRKSPQPKDGAYTRQDAEDDRFVDYTGAVQSIVTSGASNESGMFETNLRDERFLPFEGAGAESTWKLDLPEDYRAFDYDTISDVILHVRYTARQGVDTTKVKAALDDLFQPAGQAGLAQLVSLRHDFPTQWSAFVSGTDDFTATIRRDYFPYFTQGKELAITGFELYAQDASKHHVVGDQATWDAATADLGDASKGAFTFTLAPDPPGPTQVLTRNPDMDVFFVVSYTLT